MWRRILASVVVISTIITLVECEPQVPCYFIFGDSLSDVGNNNNLNTLARANYPPYGVDFKGGVITGRFSNGRNFVDVLTELLGFDKYIPPYSTATGKEILMGVNYASGAAGIRLESGQHLGPRISMDQQVANHLLTIAKMAWLKPISFMTQLNKCLYTVNIGSNDYINNYFMPEYYSSSRIYTPDHYADALINQLHRQLKRLYLAGARKVAVFGLGEIGCTLAEIAMQGTDGSLCVDKINDAVQLFNQRLISLIDELNDNFFGATFTYIGSGSSDTGSLVVNATCCELRGDYQCKESGKICSDRNNYIFWDGFHPTEIANIATANNAYSAVNPNDVYPVDIKTLVSSNDLLLLKTTTKGRSSSR